MPWDVQIFGECKQVSSSYSTNIEEGSTTRDAESEVDCAKHNLVHAKHALSRGSGGIPPGNFLKISVATEIEF